MLVAAAVSPNESRNTKFIVVCSGTGARPSPWSPAAAPRTARAARTTPSPLFPPIGRGAAVLRATALPRRCRNGGAGCARASRLTLYRACSAEAGREAPMGAREVAYSTGLYDQCIDLERKWAKRAHPRPRGREAARSRGRGVAGLSSGAAKEPESWWEPEQEENRGGIPWRAHRSAGRRQEPELRRSRSTRARGRDGLAGLLRRRGRRGFPHPTPLAARVAQGSANQRVRTPQPRHGTFFPDRREPLSRCAAAPLRR